MNRLPPAGDGRWRLPRHAHLVVYEAGRFRDASKDDDGGSEGTDGGGAETDAGGAVGDEPDELVTIYDCGAAQKPPSAQFIGHLVRVRADAEIDRTETGYVVRMREPAVLEEQDEGRWVVAAGAE